MLPLTPRRQDNMIAWLAARSDAPNYGKLVVYKFPKERLVFGPLQVEGRIDQDPTISSQFTLWNQARSQRNPRQHAGDPDRQLQPLRRADLSPGPERPDPGAEAGGRLDRQPRRHGGRPWKRR